MVKGLEAKIAKHVLRSVLARSCAIRIDDEEVNLIRATTDLDEAFEELGYSEYNFIEGLDEHDKSVGWVQLIWGNGEDLISDCSESFADINFEC